MSGGQDARTLAVIGLLVVLSFILPHGQSDFMAIWLAGDAYAHGQFDLIYPPVGDVFTMSAPAQWIARAREIGFEGEVFPFLYPPLWAAVFGWITTVAPLSVAADLVDVANPLLFAATLGLALRLSGTRMARDRYVLVGMALYFVTSVGFVALYQGQAQILIAFLTLLAIERAENDRPVAAGIALAFAAALKLYPALLVLIWLAEGRRRAALVFLLAGGGLALVSVAVAGWPLHADFLAGVSAISGTVMISPIIFSIDSLAAQALLPDAIVYVPSTVAGGDAASGWFVIAKPHWLRLALLAAELGVVAVHAILLRRVRQPGPRAMIWGAALIGIGLFGPISWSYHYIAPMALVPLLADRRGWAGWALVLVAALGLSVYMPEFGATVPVAIDLRQVIGTTTLVVLWVAFVGYALRPDGSARSRPAPP